MCALQGLIPGYGGHKREAKFSYGSSIYVNGIPQGDAGGDWSKGAGLVPGGAGGW